VDFVDPVERRNSPERLFVSKTKAFHGTQWDFPVWYANCEHNVNGFVSRNGSSNVKRVLIVDDEPLIRSALSKALKGIAVVETAATGEQANARVRARSYDLCFLDVVLPDVSGLEVMQQIKKTSPKTKIVIMTAYATDTVREEIQKEAYRFMEKPLNLAQIKEIVR